MEPFLEALLGFLFELFLQIVGEVLTEFGWRAVTEVFNGNEVKNPILAMVGHLLVGAGVGFVSLLFFRHALLHSPNARVLNLFLTPIVAGFAMTAMGAIRRKRGQEVVRLDRFGYGFIFAFGMALVRFLYAAKSS